MRVNITLKSIGKPDSLRARGRGYDEFNCATFEMDINDIKSEFWIPLPRGTRIDDPDIGKIMRAHCHATFLEFVKRTGDWKADDPE